MSANQPKICVVGSSNIDLLVRVPSLPAPGETLRGHDFKVGFGGKGANQAVMASRLGARVTMVTQLGEDDFGRQTLANYQAQGIDTAHVRFDQEAASGVALIAVDENTGQNSIVLASGANDTMTSDNVRTASAAVAAADVVLCQLEIPQEVTLAAFSTAKSMGRALTILNPAPASALGSDLLALTDVIIPNQGEAAALSLLSIKDRDSAVAAGRQLQNRGPKIVVITLGELGALILDGAEPPQFVSTEPVQAVDTTGAGDAFVGSFAYFVAQGHNPSESARRACVIASRSVLKHGTQTSFPTRAEVAKLLG